MILVLNFLVSATPKSIALEPGEYRVGREEGNDIVLSEFTVSRKHCLLYYKKNKWWVKDLKSKNGVYTDGKRVKGSAELKNGTRIYMGSFPAEVRLYSPRDYLQEAITPLPVKVTLWEDTLSLSSSGVIERSVKENLLRVMENLEHLSGFDLEEQLREVLTMAGVEGFGIVVISGGEAVEVLTLDAPPLVSVYRQNLPEEEFQVELDGKILTNIPLKDSAFFLLTPSSPPEWLVSVLRVMVRFLVFMQREKLFPAPGTDPPDALSHEDSLPRSPLVFESPQMKEVLKEARKIAPMEGNVLIEGESGVGKEIIARLIHQWSPRRHKEFIPVSMPALPDTLAESELFGVKAGAVTGVMGRKGKFEVAHRGTIFLDEIGEIPIFFQAKLLRAVETGEIPKIGEARPVKVDVRVISATNRDLEKMMEEGKFRKDLYFRLSEFKIFIPPLRERREDIIPLAEAYARVFSKFMGKHYMGISEEAREILLAYPWPGNVRELIHEIKRAVLAMGEDGIITKECLSVRPRAVSSGELERVERETILKVLERTNWNKTRAAEILGITRPGLINKMKRLGIEGKPGKFS